MKCTKTEDCPLYSICDLNNKCLYKLFICPENENDPCSFVNTTIYDTVNEEIYFEYSNIKEKPILKTCSIEQFEKKRCKTKKCLKNEDCFSGQCVSNSCVSNSAIYNCAGSTRDDENIICGKVNNMKCEKDEECFSHYCNNNICELDRVNPKIYLYGPLILLLIVLIITFMKLLKKQNQNEKERKNF